MIQENGKSQTKIKCLLKGLTWLFWSMIWSMNKKLPINYISYEFWVAGELKYQKAFLWYLHNFVRVGLYDTFEFMLYFCNSFIGELFLFNSISYSQFTRIDGSPINRVVPRSHTIIKIALPTTCQRNNPITSMTHVACESKLLSVVMSSMHPYPGYWVAIMWAVVYSARSAHTFSAWIQCRHWRILGNSYFMNSCFISIQPPWFSFTKLMKVSAHAYLNRCCIVSERNMDIVDKVAQLVRCRTVIRGFLVRFPAGVLSSVLGQDSLSHIGSVHPAAKWVPSIYKAVLRACVLYAANCFGISLGGLKWCPCVRAC